MSWFSRLFGRKPPVAAAPVSANAAPVSANAAPVSANTAPVSANAAKVDPSILKLENIKSNRSGRGNIYEDYEEYMNETEEERAITNKLRKQYIERKNEIEAYLKEREEREEREERKKREEREERETADMYGLQGGRRRNKRKSNSKTKRKTKSKRRSRKNF
jgi:hypothetical protein